MNESTMQNDTEIRWIPLRDLQPSGRNARTTAAPAEAMRELEASLEAHGLLENLVVRANDDGKTFQVVGGGRRLQGLRTLAKKRRSRFRTTTPIPCRVMPDDSIDEEISAAENLVRVNMHPVDQFTAFHTMLERGLNAREIANRFGLTARTVQRRLRLGGVAPEILGHARDGHLTLDQLEAFAATTRRSRGGARRNPDIGIPPAGSRIRTRACHGARGRAAEGRAPSAPRPPRPSCRRAARRPPAASAGISAPGCAGSISQISTTGRPSHLHALALVALPADRL